jgi:hypothetical protein
VIGSHSYHERALFRRHGVLLLPSSFNGWLILCAALGMCFTVTLPLSLQSFSIESVAKDALVFNIPVFLFYQWIASQCSKEK